MKLKLKLARASIDDLLHLLQSQDYEVMAPSVVDDVIQFKVINDSSDLPMGITDEQSPGNYRLVKNNEKSLFAYNCSSDSLKSFLMPNPEPLFVTENNAGELKIKIKRPKQRKVAFLGLKACDIAALRILDAVFLKGLEEDVHYKARRNNILTIATNCTTVGNNCFCTSMDTGPAVSSGFDMALTEIIDGKEHYFVVDSGSDVGLSLLKKLNLNTVSKQEQLAEDNALQKTKSLVKKNIDSQKARTILPTVSDDPRWQHVADRCLSCSNCTMVCPTCFCNSTETNVDINANTTEHVRKRDSCFNVDFSYTVGETYRKSVSSRYRNWLTHKFSSWFEQFGTSGCVGCGRCVTFCPVGIDVTEEIGEFVENANTK